jgi:hypothetical protein
MQPLRPLSLQPVPGRQTWDPLEMIGPGTRVRSLDDLVLMTGTDRMLLDQLILTPSDSYKAGQTIG